MDRRTAAVVLATLFVSLLLVTAPAAHAATPVSGPITEDTTWDQTGSPYTLSGDVTVTQDSTLTVEPGVVVRGQDGARLLVAGALHSVGTVPDPVVFRRDDPEGGWGGIVLVGELNSPLDTRSVIEHTTVEFADVGLLSRYDAPTLDNNFFASNSVALDILGPKDSTVTISNSRIVNNGVGLTGRATHEIDVLRNDFWNNDTNILAGPKATFDCVSEVGAGWEIHENDILRGPQNNKYFSNDVRTPAGSNHSNYTVDATDNWWGTTNLNRIEGRLRGQRNCCPSPAQKIAQVSPVSQSPHTDYTPPGTVPDPDPTNSTHSDPATVVFIANPKHGACLRASRFSRVHGTASAALSSLNSVYLAVARDKGDGLCSWWSKRRQKLVSGFCSEPKWFRAQGRRDWSYRFPYHLPPGHYTLLANGNSPGGRTGEPGRSLVNFTLKNS
jgi:hypothetical protein